MEPMPPAADPSVFSGAPAAPVAAGPPGGGAGPTPPPEPGSVKGLLVAKVLTWLVYAYVIVAVVMLTLYFFLLLFNADPSASFAEWVYRSADRVMEPFRGIFPTKEAGNGSVLDFAVLFAMLVYGIVALLLHSLISWLDYRVRLDRWRAAHPGQVPPPR